MMENSEKDKLGSFGCNDRGTVYSREAVVLVTTCKHYLVMIVKCLSQSYR